MKRLVLFFYEKMIFDFQSVHSVQFDAVDLIECASMSASLPLWLNTLLTTESAEYTE
jgi:hypothetical protein